MPEFFFSGLIFPTVKVVLITTKIAFIFTYLSTVHIYVYHVFTVIYSHNSRIFTSEYEATSSIFLRIKQKPHKLWMTSNNYVFGDGLLYVLND